MKICYLAVWDTAIILAVTVWFIISVKPLKSNLDPIERATLNLSLRETRIVLEFKVVHGFNQMRYCNVIMISFALQNKYT